MSEGQKDLGSESESNSSKIRTFSDALVTLSSEIEGGNGYDFKKYDKNVYGFKPERDHPSKIDIGGEYSKQAYYYKFSIKNLTEDEVRCTVSAIADYDDTWQGWFFNSKGKLWVYGDLTPYHYDPKLVRTTPNSQGISIVLAPRETKTLSNMLVMPYSQICFDLQDIQMQYPTFIQFKEVGRSPKKNVMYSVIIHPNDLHWRDTNKYHLIIGGSPQTNEFGDYAVLLLLKKFLKKGPEFWDEFHKTCKLEFIFFQNPDGMIAGKNMVNALGQNLFFGYPDVILNDVKNEENKRDKDESGSPDQDILALENRIIWDYLRADPPDVYLEYHSFFQDYKTIRPYLYPVQLFKDKTRQKLYKKIADALVSYSNGGKEAISINQAYFSNTLAYRLQEKYSCLSFQYKLHSSMTKIDIEEYAWEVFDLVQSRLRKFER